jgi:hypothetical protein
MTLGAKCGVDDSDAILRLHNLCNRLGIDSLSAGSSIAFAMEAFDKKDLTAEQADGLNLNWGNKAAMEALLENIAFRRGLGDLLAEGAARASRKIGGIAGGVFTATEAAAVAVAYICVIGIFVYKEIPLKSLRTHLVAAGKTSGSILFIISCARTFRPGCWPLSRCLKCSPSAC